MLRQKVIAVMIFTILTAGQTGISDVLWDHDLTEDYQKLSEFSSYNPPSLDCCFCLAIDGNNLLAGTSEGLISWNVRKDELTIFKTDSNWGGKYAKTLSDANEKHYVEKWLSNSVERIVVLSPGQIWVDMFKGVLVIRDGQAVYYASIEEGLQSLYNSDLKRLLRKVTAVDRNEHLHLLKGRIKEYIEGSVLKRYDGEVWKEEQSKLCDRSRAFSPGKNIEFYDIIADAKGDIWTCSIEGILKIRENCWEILDGGTYRKLWLGDDGVLWAFGSGELAKLEDGSWKVYKKGQGTYKDFSGVLQHYLSPPPVIFQTPDNRLWFGASINDEGKALCYDGRAFSEEPFYLSAATSNSRGQFLAASGGRLFSYNKGKWEQIPIPYLKKRGAGSGADDGEIIRDILITDSGITYVASIYGMLRCEGGKWDRLSWKKSKLSRTGASEDEPDEGSELPSGEQWLATGGIGPVPEALIQEMYQSYIEGEGKYLIKATNEQLSKHIVDMKDNGSVVSYYRLVGRDKKLANISLREMIKVICSSGGVGEFTSMQVACFGPQAVAVLVDIAETGTEQERVLAIDSLEFMKDPNVINKLLEMLDDHDEFDKLFFVRLARIAVACGKPEGMSILIQGATTKGKYQKAYQIELGTVTSLFQDVPDDWSSEKWTVWWQEHSSSWQPSGEYLDPMLVNSVKAQQRLLEIVAKKIESKKH